MEKKSRSGGSQAPNAPYKRGPIPIYETVIFPGIVFMQVMDYKNIDALRMPVLRYR